MSSNYQEMALSIHNELRAKHGAPPLQWSTECEDKAQQQAQECESSGCLAHGNMDGSSGRHGQNVFWCSRPEPPQAAVQSWYDELENHGYSFGSNNPNPGTGHFTQVVWAGTQEIGMAASADGTYHVANYFPAGNMMGDYARNVFPPGSEMTAPSTLPPSSNESGWAMQGPPEPEQAQCAEEQTATEGTCTSTSMTPFMAMLLQDCPVPSIEEAVMQAFANGDEVTVTRGARDIEVNVKTRCGQSMQQAMW